jgi:hypothetical protein
MMKNIYGYITGCIPKIVLEVVPVSMRLKGVSNKCNYLFLCPNVSNLRIKDYVCNIDTRSTCKKI